MVKDWLATAKHPKSKRPYTEMVYQPMLELLAYLRANGFKTYIVSGGGIEFMRPWTEQVYGIPPEQVIGSSIKTEFQIRDGTPVLVRLPEINFIDDKAGKPVGAPLPHSVIPTATCRCCNGHALVTASDSASTCTTPMPGANGHTTAIPASAAWTRVWMERKREAGRS